MYLEIDPFLTLIAHFLKNKVYPTPMSHDAKKIRISPANLPRSWLSWWNNWKSKITEEVLAVLKVFVDGLVTDK